MIRNTLSVPVILVCLACGQAPNAPPDTAAPRPDAGDPLDAETRSDAASDDADAGADADQPDAFVDPRTRECGEWIAIPDAFLPRCTAETRTCVEGCAVGAGLESCITGCAAADPTPPSRGIDCPTCITAQFATCLWERGCDLELASFLCCQDDCENGPGSPSPGECQEGPCRASLLALSACIPASCATYDDATIDLCYADAAP